MTKEEIKARIFINLASDSSLTPHSAYAIAATWAECWESNQENIHDNQEKIPDRIPQKEWVAFDVIKPPSKVPIQVKSDKKPTRIVKSLSNTDIRYCILSNENYKWRDIDDIDLT